MGWVRVFFFKALVVDGGEGRALYFFTFLIVMSVIFWDLLLLKEGRGESGAGGFFVKKKIVNFFDRFKVF